MYDYDALDYAEGRCLQDGEGLSEANQSGVCHNIHYIGDARRGMRPECMRFGKPCLNVSAADCYHKAEGRMSKGGRVKHGV